MRQNANQRLNNAMHADSAMTSGFESAITGAELVTANRYATMHRMSLITVLGLSSLMLLGCPARWKVVFINGAGCPLSVQLSDGLDGKRTAFTLSQGASRSELLERVQSLGVFDTSGGLLFRRDDFGSVDLTPPLKGKYPHIYVLLTLTNAYIIPADYSKTWKEHIDEITERKA